MQAWDEPDWNRLSGDGITWVSNLSHLFCDFCNFSLAKKKVLVEVLFIPFRYIIKSWGAATCLFRAAVLSVTFPSLVGALGAVGAFDFYARFVHWSSWWGPGKYTKIPDPKVLKFCDFYPSHFGQILSKIRTTPPPNPIFTQISD